jgi:hypothetical protein
MEYSSKLVEPTLEQNTITLLVYTISVADISETNHSNVNGYILEKRHLYIVQTTKN